MRSTFYILVLLMTAAGLALGQTAPPQNVLALDVQAASLFVRPGEPVLVRLDVSNLAQMVNGCQALIGFNSAYLTAPHSVVPGGGYWSELIYENWSVPGELDTAIGIQLEGGPAGTDADSTVALINLTAGATEGIAAIVFRTDVDDKYATMLSGLDTEPVWPHKLDGQQIVIDGTPPELLIDHASQGSNELLDSLGSTANAVQGLVEIAVVATDPLAGLVAPPTVTVEDSAHSVLAVTYTGETPPGTFNYTVQIEASTANGRASIAVSATDKAGNTATADDSFRINKNQITGTIEFDTASTQNYTVDRPVLFVATNSGGSILRQWTPTIHFSNIPASRAARGTFALADVPAGAVRISAKTAWSLRRRLTLSWNADYQAVADYKVSAGTHLRTGDITNDNVINTPDYVTLKANWYGYVPFADMNGDGPVQTLDYMVMKNNWFTAGDPP